MIWLATSRLVSDGLEASHILRCFGQSGTPAIDRSCFSVTESRPHAAHVLLRAEGHRQDLVLLGRSSARGLRARRAPLNRQRRGAILGALVLGAERSVSLPFRPTLHPPLHKATIKRRPKTESDLDIEGLFCRAGLPMGGFAGGCAEWYGSDKLGWLETRLCTT
jgi:hypothetical protein